MIDSVLISPRTAVMIGIAIAVAVPNASSKITTAAASPIATLLPVLGLDSCWPAYPPSDTCNPA